MTGTATTGRQLLAVHRRTGLMPFIAIMRPFTLLPPFLGIVSGSFAAIGSLAARGQGSFIGLLASHWHLILAGGVMASILNGASNTLNQITEVELDRRNKPDRVLPRGEMSMGVAVAYCLLLYVLALALAWCIGLGRGRDTFWCVAVASAFTIAYSVKPIYGKSRGWWANVTIAAPRGCLLKVAGWGCVASALASPEPWLIGTVFMLFLLGAAATKDFSDLEGDRAGGVETLAVRLGLERTAHVISPFFIVPWLGFVLGVLPIWGGRAVLHTNAAATVALVAVLTAYGLYVAHVMWTRPKQFSLEGNHVSWAHMYRMMMLAQVGLVVCYIV